MDDSFSCLDPIDAEMEVVGGDTLTGSGFETEEIELAFKPLPDEAEE
jgi:hypothetical protein